MIRERNMAFTQVGLRYEMALYGNRPLGQCRIAGIASPCAVVASSAVNELSAGRFLPAEGGLVGVAIACLGSFRRKQLQEHGPAQ